MRLRKGWWVVLVVAPLMAFGVYVVSFPWWRPQPHEVDAWKVPTQMPQGEKGELVRYGEQLFNKTPLYLGPAVKDVAMRYAGNGLECANCHARGGTVKNKLGLVGVASQFPQFNARADRTITLAERVQGCMMRSMNGRELPPDSRELKAFVAYITWLSSEVPQGTKKIAGQGVPELTPIDHWADPDMGAAVFKQTCTRCHGPTGQGQKNPDGTYTHPALWGPDSYNDGAGMNRVHTLASFVYANMPEDGPNLTVEQAYDVAAYVATQARPHMEHLDRDYPDLTKKPFDTAYGPYADGLSEARHKYGPFPAPAETP